MTRRARKILVVGWDAADWDVIAPLREAGLLPTLDGLIRRGVSGNLATLDPPFSPMLWTSIATGKTADKHGILGFTQPRSDGQGVRPVLGSSRTAKAFWTIAHESGLRSAIVGWWPTHPAEPIDGVMVSNLFHRVRGAVEAPAPSPPGAVHPPALAAVLDALRMHPGEVTPELLLPFVPSFAGSDEEPSETEQKGLEAIARSLAEAASVHAAATWTLEHTDWDVAAVYLDTIDRVSHGFMRYHPPRQPHVPATLFERFREVVTATYRFHDMMLDRLLALAGEDATVLLVSDHGFESGPRRLAEIPNEPAGPAAEHRSFGVFVAAGPGIRHGERVYGANLLDVTPTLLTLLGLPVGDDMDGRVLTPIFQDPPTVARIPTWEITDDTGHTAPPLPDPLAERAALDQLVALGYVEPPDADGTRAAATSTREAGYALARVFLWKGQPERAVPLVESAWHETKAARYGFTLLQAYERLRQYDAALALADEIEAAPRDPDASTDSPLRSPGLDLVRGRLLLALGDTDQALEHLHRAAGAGGNAPAFLRDLGVAYTRAGRADDAERVFRRALDADPDRPDVLRAFAHLLLHTDRPEVARDVMLDALGLQFFDPAGHLLLGQALLDTGEPARAAQALELAIAQRPSLARARFLLAEIYRDHLDRPADAGRLMAGSEPHADAHSVAQRPEDRDTGTS